MFDADVFEALLTYIHILIVVFASWNIIAAKSSRMSSEQHRPLRWCDANTCFPAPGASVFLLTSSVLIFVLVPMCVIIWSQSLTRIETFVCWLGRILLI